MEQNTLSNFFFLEETMSSSNKENGYVKVTIKNLDDSDKNLNSSCEVIFSEPEEKKDNLNEGLKLPKIIPIYQEEWNPLTNEIETEEDISTMK